MANQAEERDRKTRKIVGAILFAIAGLGVVAIIAIVLMYPDSFKGGSNSNTPTSTQATETPQIQYEKVDLQDMLDELDANAMRAEEKYQDKHIEITGKISVFDSDGKYIAIVPCDAHKLSLDSVHCNLTDQTHKTFLLEKNVGDVVTIKGKVVSIGEILGYSVKIAEISD